MKQSYRSQSRYKREGPKLSRRSFVACIAQTVMAATLMVFAGSELARAQEQNSASRKLIDRTPVTGDAYILAADDEITIRSLQAKEITDKPFRIDKTGEVNFPLLGSIHLAGTTAHEAEALLREQLKRFYVEPDVALNITARHSETASVIGAVGAPGVHQIHDQTTLLDALSLAGGVRGDAGAVVRITRQHTHGKIPH